jgi:putative membrane-bound dehydrogenase-like protein
MRSFALLVVLFIVTPVFAEVPVGVAKVDITPAYPIRLSGYGFRRDESEGVIQKIWAKALVIGEKEPAVLLAVDTCGLSHDFVEKLAGSLKTKLGIERERLAVTVTHSHTTPMVEGYLDTLFGTAIPPEHQKTISRYTRELEAKLVSVVEEALQNRAPAKLSWGMGWTSFARNRRPAALQTPSKFGSNASQLTSPGNSYPVDHDMPLLAVHDPAGKLRAVWINYACHCTTLSLNQITGDWAGYAAAQLEGEFPGTVALISIGCGADANPERADRQDKIEYAEKQGGFISAEATRLLKGFLAPLPETVRSKYHTFTLPLAPLPSQEVLQERAKRNDAVGYQARVSLERLARKEKLPTEIPYSVQTWSFGTDMAMVFLPGEVVVDYALRLKKELHSQRLWVNAYANHVPCYIPSERILKEGGYEGGGAMTYYNLSSPLSTGLEDKIIGECMRQLKDFKAPYEVSKLSGSKPLSPQQSASLIKVAPQFTVELVASEPLVVDPVAIAFGPEGKLWVAEMADYPSGMSDAEAKVVAPGLPETGKKLPGGRIRFLEDNNGDGKYDKGTVFLDNIPYPTGVTVWRKGVLICAAPDILYAEDTNGDGKADVVKVLFSGFGTHNFQARVNSLEYGLDGWVHGSCGLFGGTIKSFNGKTYALGNRDFRIKPDTGELEPASGQTQQGRVRDDFDNWFGCDNTELANHYPMMDHYLRRNPYVKPANNRVFLPTGPNANRLFTLRSQVQLFELSGPPGWPTAACGLGVYRDTLLGEKLYGNLFTCEAVNLLVHRMVLKENGATFTGHRADDEPDREFLASTDGWFRPVQMRTGPDGCIYIVDMHRLVIEHPIWIPSADLAKLDVRAGSTMGRLYRIKPAKGELRKMPRLDRMTADELVAAMNTPNGTQRDLAMMQLLWKGEKPRREAFEPLLKNEVPAVKLQALATMSELKLVDLPILKRALADDHPDVRKHIWRMAEGLKDVQTLGRSNQSPPSTQEMMHIVWAFGTWEDPIAGGLLANFLASPGHGEDQHFRTAVFTALRTVHHEQFLTMIIKDAHEGHYSAEFMKQLIPVLAQGDATRAAALLQPLATPGKNGFAAWQYQAVSSLPLMQKVSITPEQQALLQPMYTAARATLEKDASEAERLAALSMLLGPGQPAEQTQQNKQLLLNLLGPSATPTVQQAALGLLSKHLDQPLAEQLLKNWLTYSPTLRSRMVDLFLSRGPWQQLLLQAIVSKTVPASHLDASSKQRLLKSRDAGIAKLATQVFEATSSDRAGLIQQYTTSLKTTGDLAKGKAHFTRVCATCHQLGEQGHAVGPDLTALANRNNSFLLQEILDPSKNLDSRYIEYVAITKNGRTLTGLLSGEAGSSLTLKGKEGRSETLLRSELDELQATGKSLMPEGLEKELKPEEMSDLLAYLQSMRQNFKTLAGNTPASTITAVQSVHTLHASQAEIYGRDITYEPSFQNIGYWHSRNDYVSWTIDVPTKGSYDLYFDWACDNASAGNRYVVEIGSTTLEGEIAGTGGWSQYLRVRVAAGFTLQAGVQRVKVRPAGDIRGALMDLRTLYIAPNEHRLQLPEGTQRAKPDAATLASQILNDRLPEKDRQALIEQNLAQAPEIIVAMTTGMPNDTKEEYRRIPWIWRVAIAATKKNDPVVVARLMDIAMPAVNTPLRDWQAVVIGGGVINGFGLIDLWPHEQIAKLITTPERQAKWQWLLKQSHAMAHNEKVHTGTRYDALRIIALDKPELAVPGLLKYLPAGGNEEMQQGAVSGLVDVPTSEAAKQLCKALVYLQGENRELALIGMMRSEARFGLILEMIVEKTVQPNWFTPKLQQQLRKQQTGWSQAMQERVKLRLK